MNSDFVLIDNIPFDQDFSVFAEKTGIDKYKSMTDDARKLFDEAASLLRPKAVYRHCFIDRKEDDQITVEGVAFRSDILRRNLNDVERVFAYVGTCGTELEDFSLNPGDLMEKFFLDELKELALRTALDHLRRHVMEKYKIKKIAAMNPGSGDIHVWPIDQQRELFSLLNGAPGEIGVELTPSFLMVPNKTVSGIYFPTEVDFESCQECRRENCPDRRAAYAGHPGLS